MGTTRKAHASAVVGGKLYVFGGTGEDDDGDEEDFSTAEVYDPASDGWAPVSSLTSERSGMAAIAF